MLCRKLMSVACAAWLLSGVAGSAAHASASGVGGQSGSGVKARRVAAKKKRKRVNPNSDRGKAGASSEASAGGVEGTWGGEHVRLSVSRGGGEIEYDCAHGTINEPLAPDAEGHFDVRGTHVRESPGPVRLGVNPPSRPARYSGTVRGRTMTLTVTLTDTSEDLGTFTLTRGSAGRLHKCR